MGRTEKTVFISYRRTNVPWALAIYQNLTHHGFDVFFDYQIIDSGNFEKVILENIKARAHFLVILTPSSLDRCKDPGDWLRREIETAMDEKRNIVPLMLESFDFGSPPVKDALTGKLDTLNSYNGLRVYSEYFFEAMDKLRQRYLNVALSEIALPSINAEAKTITRSLKLAASEAAPVEKELLTAQEWSERGYVFVENKDYDEAIRCYTEVINLQPDFAEAYSNRGVARGEKGDLKGAIQDYDEAIRLNPEFGEAYNNRGVALSGIGALDKAIEDYSKAIDLKPGFSDAYNNRGKARKFIGDWDGAVKDFDETIRLQPDYAEAYFNSGNLLFNLDRYHDAEATYRKAIELNPSNFDFYDRLVRLFRFKLADRLEDTIPLLEKMIEINPEDFNSYLALASINKQLGKDVSRDYAEKSRQFMPEDDWYNRACLESVCDNFDLAFEHLQRTAQNERFNPAWAWEDSDFQWIRDDPRFVEIVGPKPE